MAIRSNFVNAARLQPLPAVKPRFEDRGVSPPRSVKALTTQYPRITQQALCHEQRSWVQDPFEHFEKANQFAELHRLWIYLPRRHCVSSASL
jgi:hypothetical protein